MKRHMLWTEEETEILIEAIKEYPDKTSYAIAKQLQEIFPNRGESSVRSKIDKLLAPEKYTYKPRKKKTEPPKEPKPQSIVERLLDVIDTIQECKETLEGIWEDVAMLETWAEQTLLVKAKLKYNVQSNGIVDKIKED